ncbi:hypothetical protein UT300003_20270 [Clostridium sardiniense]
MSQIIYNIFLIFLKLILISKSKQKYIKITLREYSLRVIRYLKYLNYFTTLTFIKLVAPTSPTGTPAAITTVSPF